MRMDDALRLAGVDARVGILWAGPVASLPSYTNFPVGGRVAVSGLDVAGSWVVLRRAPSGWLPLNPVLITSLVGSVAVPLARYQSGSVGAFVLPGGPYVLKPVSWATGTKISAEALMRRSGANGANTTISICLGTNNNSADPHLSILPIPQASGSSSFTLFNGGFVLKDKNTVIKSGSLGYQFTSPSTPAGDHVTGVGYDVDQYVSVNAVTAPNALDYYDLITLAVKVTS